MKSQQEKVLKKLREFCLSLPAATETTTFGNPTFKAGKKTFAVIDTYRGDSYLCVKVDKREKPTLLKDIRFADAPYVGKHGWVLFRSDRIIPDWKETEKLLVKSYQGVAQKKMLAALSMKHDA
jgi:predicted DNA-binding protein (MmcQ/YjbR family)